MEKKTRKRFLLLGVVAAFLLFAFPAQALAAGPTIGYSGEAYSTKVKILGGTGRRAPAVTGMGVLARAGRGLVVIERG